MTTATIATTEADQRAAHLAFTQALIDDFRANGGTVAGGPLAGRQIVLLTTTGARTGLPRTCPLVYSMDGADHIVVASKGGAPVPPAWYLNLLADPVVTVEVAGEAFQARATVIGGGPDRDRLYARHAEVEPGFLEYESRTDRVIPVVRLARIS
jgi:deazaflavin-dependent oxidoreductase (nitroreductase family)